MYPNNPQSPQGPFPPAGFGPPAGYDPTLMAAPGGYPAAHTQGLEKEAITWLIVAAVGFMFGLFWITGPLAWWQGSRIRGTYRSMGMEPAGSANVAWILGIASTVIGLLTFLAVGAMIAGMVFLGVTHPGIFTQH